MTTYGLILCLPMLALLAWAAASDWGSRRIPNWITFSLALTGLAHAWLGPWGALQVFLAEAIVGALLALVQAAGQGRLRTVLRNTAVLAGSMAAGAGDGGLTAAGAIDSAGGDTPIDKRWLPYSVPVLLATSLVLMIRWSH